MTTLPPQSEPVPSDSNAPSSEPPCKKMRVSELLGIPQQPDTSMVPDLNKALLTASGEWSAAEAITKSMPKDCGVPLTILTGFLGAGKSTVLNYILNADHGLKIAVLINEFGEVDIDNQLVDTMAQGKEGKPVMLNNGCVCCTISSGFAEAVRQTLADAEERDRFPDYFIVETTGLADPKPIMDSVVATELRDDLYLDQVLTVVDASAWTEDHYESETAMRQIESADTILLSKTDLAEDARVENVIESIVAVKPNARILRSQKGFVPIAALFDLGVSMTGPRTRKKVDKDSKNCDKCEDKHNCNHDHDHDHDHKHDHGHDDKGKHRNHLEEEGFTSISFVSEFPFSLRRFKDEFMEAIPQGVFRAKGLLWFVGELSRFIFHWSGSRYHVEEQPWPEDLEHKNQLVIIGRQLDNSEITQMLEECVVRPGEESEEEGEEYYQEEEDGAFDDGYGNDENEEGVDYGADDDDAEEGEAENELKDVPENDAAGEANKNLSGEPNKNDQGENLKASSGTGA